jgi:uncharacterized membrane protein/protein-disulfide isomerase
MSDLSEMPTPPSTTPAAKRALWGVRGLAAVALAISSYLAWLALTGRTAAGCGGEGLGCERVLSSRWSYWFDQPIGVLATSLWLTILLVSALDEPRLPEAARRVARWLLVLLTTAAAGAAVWFIGLQAFELRHWCIYCIVAHTCALVAWGLASVGLEVSPRGRKLATLGGLLLAAAIPVGQWYLPPMAYYALDHVADQPTDDPMVIADATGNATRYVEILGGAARVDVAGLPHVGKVDAKYVVVLLFDYACGHCQTMHGDLVLAQKEYKDELTVVLLPTPLSHKCNPNISEQGSTSPDACDLATLALIVWKLSPEDFADFDKWLFADDIPRNAADARAMAAKLVGEEALAAAEADPLYAMQLQQHIALMKQSPARLLPQIHGRNVILSQETASAVELLEALEAEFGFERP